MLTRLPQCWVGLDKVSRPPNLTNGENGPKAKMARKG